MIEPTILQVKGTLLTKSKFGFKVCFPRFTLFSAFYPLFRFRFSGSAIPVPPVRSVLFPRFTPTLPKPLQLINNKPENMK
jgi:hypothetical protein